MKRDLGAWLLAGPLVAAAALLAHALAYRLAGSDPQIAADHSAHHYLSHLPVFAAPSLVAVVLALSLRLARTRAGAARVRLPWAPVAVLPAPLFALQETLEQVAHTGAVRPELFARATFPLGLVLAAVLAVAALGLGRLLLGSADRVANASARPGAAFAPPSPVAATVALARVDGPLEPTLVRPTGRAPPSPVTA